jgi:adenylate cyclase
MIGKSAGQGRQIIMKFDIDYHAIYDHAPDMHISVEAGSGRIIECNRTLLNKLGYSKDEVLSKTIFEIYHPGDLEKVQENVRLFSNTGELTYTELRALKKNGDIIEINLNYVPVRNDQGEIIYSNATLRDVSELKQTQRALEAERLRTEELLFNTLPKPIVERLKKSPSVIADRFENATILFCDIKGFSSIASTISPDQLISSLNVVFSEFDYLVSFYGLEKIKTIGDAYMVAGGLPVPRDDHAEVIADLALEMRSTLDRLNQIFDQPLQVRIGINSGAVIAGVIGKKKLAYDLWGESVNIASRMEAHGLVGGIQVGETTYQLIKDNYVFEDRGEIPVKGGELLRAYLLKSKRAA